MQPTPRRITDPDTGTRPLQAWLAGLALTMLGVGSYGAWQPLLPADTVVRSAAHDEIAIMDFMPADQAQGAEAENAAREETQIEVEIPPLPEIAPPLTPPEVPEILPLDTPPPVPQTKPTEPKPAPKPKPTAAARPTAPASSGTGTGNAPTLFSGVGTGRFTSPSYPASSRAARQQGTVRVLVTVESSGLPSSVEVQTSSGFSALDRSAVDHIQRKWRWPEGAVRRFIVPIRFVLQ